MRASVRASTFTAAAAITAFIGCASPTPKAPPPRDPPPHVLTLSIDRIALRTTAWMELHAWLATIARGRTTGPNDFEPAAERYGAALRDDETDALLWRSSRALATCNADACAAKVLDATSLGVPFNAAYGAFVDRFWTERSATAQAGVGVARAAMSRGELDPLLTTVAEALVLSWPDVATVDVVAEAPPPARHAILPIALGAKGSCFLRGDHEDHDRVYDARVLDCVLTHAALGLGDRSRLFAAITRELPVPEAERAWEILVVHGVAATIAAWEPHHASVYRRAVESVEPKALAWLAENWKWRASGEAVEAFAARYAAALKPPPSTCTKSAECAVGHQHHPCCLQGDGAAKCFLLPPKAHGCPGRELCQADGDCRGDEKCRPFEGGPAKTCQGGASKGGPAIPGKCINRPPNAPRDPDCEAIHE